MDPRLLRLKALQDGFDAHPGRGLNGTGDTGLASNDAQGYSQMLNEQTEFMNLQNELDGKGPVKVKRGRTMGGGNHSSLDGLQVAAGQFNPWLRG